MKIIAYIFTTIICAHLSFATSPVENTQLMTKEWTLSLSTYSIHSPAYVYRLGNGDVVVTSPESVAYGSGIRITIFDYNGNLVMQDAFSDGSQWTPLGYMENSMFGVKKTDSMYRFYSAKNNGYEFIDLPVDANNEQNASLSLTVNDPTIYYFISTTNQSVYLHKYKTDISELSENIVSGHVSSGFYQDNYVLNWESGLGIQYQIQSSTNLVDWTPVGQVLTGTGYPMSWANHVTNSQAFYRVVED